MRRALTYTTGTAAFATALAAIWEPYGSWWQWLATALVLTFTTAALAPTADKAPSGDAVSEIERYVNGSGDTR